MVMMKHVLLAIGIVCAATAFGQEVKIEADRPTEGPSAEVVSKRTFQTELGVRKEQENSRDFSWQYPEVLLRYGLLDRVELRLHTTIETQRDHTKNEFTDGVTPVELGLKATVFQTKDTSFTTSLYGHIGLQSLAQKSINTIPPITVYEPCLKTSSPKK